LVQTTFQPAVTYYDILEVSQAARAEEIKQAYRRLAMLWHPDRNRGNRRVAETKLQELNEAYALLRDPARRAHYDRLLKQQRARLMAGNDNGTSRQGLMKQFWSWLFVLDSQNR
jgi:curved DNA-binding protein CbpA